MSQDLSAKLNVHPNMPIGALVAALQQAPEVKVLVETPTTPEDLTAILKWDKAEQPRQKRARLLTEQVSKMVQELRQLQQQSAEEALALYNTVAKRLGYEGGVEELAAAGRKLRFTPDKSAVQVIEVTAVEPVAPSAAASAAPSSN